MKKQIASVAGAVAIAGGVLLGFSGTAEAAAAAPSPECVGTPALPGSPESSHFEYLYKTYDWATGRYVYEYQLVDNGGSYVDGADKFWEFVPGGKKTVIDPAVPGTPAVPSAVDQLPGTLDYGTPFVTHGGLGESHIRGGDWSVTSKAVSGVAGTFGTYSTPSSLLSTKSASDVITRWRITFTPDNTNILAKIKCGDLPNFGTRLGGGFLQGNAQILNDKVVVHIYKIGLVKSDA